MNKHTSLTDLGAVTHRRAVRADGSVREHAYKTVRVAGRHGGATTVDVPVDTVYAWMHAYRVSLADITRVMRDAAQLLRRSPPTSSGIYLSWSSLVRARALKLLQAVAAGAPLAEATWAAQNNAAWDAAIGDNE